MNRATTRQGFLLSKEPYTYDNANWLTQVQQGTSTVKLAYDKADRRTSLTLPNGNRIIYAYDAASRLMRKIETREGRGIRGFSDPCKPIISHL